MPSNAFDAGIGDLTLHAGLPSGALNVAADALAAGLASQQLTIAGARKEIVFIEDDVADYQLIASNAGAGREVVILDSSKDGLQQIADALQGRTGIDALHVVTHGAEGKIKLGALALDAASAAGHAGLLHTIGQSLALGGDILLYGCDVAAGQGAGFVDQLAIATGADVAASNDLTGDARLGGDWNLEVATGSIETAPVVSAALAAQYHELLSISSATTVTFTNAPFTSPTGSGTDLAYSIPGFPGYTLKFDGHQEGVGTYGTLYAPDAYVSFAASSNEDKITIGFTGGQLFTPSSIKVNGNASGAQTLIFTGLAADGSEVTHTSVDILAGTLITDFVQKNLSGFTNIKTLVITPQAGNSILYFQMDDLVLANAQAPAPAVISVSATTANGTYKAGDVIQIAVDFDQNVTVNTSGGTPQLKLETGSTDHSAVYANGSGTNALTFNYTVQAGDTSADLDYFNTTALSLNGGTIKSSGGLDATLTLPAPGSAGSLGLNNAIVIDTTAPNAPSTPDLLAGSDSGASNSDNLTNNTLPTFSGTFADGDVTMVKLYDTDGVTQVGSHTVSGGTYSFALSTPLGDGSHTITAKAVDAAGNVSAASSGLTITVDTTPPTVSVAGSTSALKVGDTSTITFTFSEDPGASFTAGDVTVSGGTLGTINGTGTTRTATFTPTANTDNGSASISVAANSYADAAGNNGSAGGPLLIGYDTNAPTLAITSSQPALKIGETATITFTFSEDPQTSFTNTDVTVSGGTLGAITGSGLTRHAVFTPDAGVDRTTASITVAAGSYADTAGNPGGAGATPTITYDTLAPAAPSAPVLDTGSDSGISHADGLTRETALVFNGTAEANASITLYDTDGTTQVGSGSANAAGVWQITTGTLLPGAHTITAVSTDALGNAGPASTGTPVTIDTTGPTVAITSDQPTLAIGQSAIITFTFSENPGTSFSWDGSTGSIAVSGGTLSALSGTGPVRTAVFTPTAGVDSGSASITVAAGAYTDEAGNAGAAGATPSITYDTLAPGATSLPVLDTGSDSGASHTDGVTNSSTLSFSGSAQAGATVKLYDGATEIGHATATGGVYTIVVAGAATLAEGSHSITAVAFDSAGNAGTASGALTVLVDRTPPGTLVTGATLSADTGSSATDMITSAASQTISGTLGANLAAGEQVMVSINNGATWSAATASAGQNTWSLAATLAGSNTLQVRVLDLAGNAGAVYSHAYTVDTVAPPAPAAPALAAASDTGTPGDGITEESRPVIEGTALANTRVTLFDTVGASQVQIGSTTADAAGHWSILTSGLAVGGHALTAVQSDTAGNASAASAAFALTIAAPPPPPVIVVDGVPVDVQPVIVPGGAIGTEISIPIVSTTRTDTSGKLGVADIPILTTSQGENLLLAQLAPGFGLSASGANVPVTNAGQLLIAAIKAATPANTADDQGHLSANGHAFLDALAAGGSLLVETVKPVGGAAVPDGTFTLSGPVSMPGQSTALVIDATGLAPGNTINLKQVNFAAVIGAANLVAPGGNTVLSGDAASQHFTVAGGGSGSVFGGAGDDVLSVDTSSTAAAGVTLLHGGADRDVATFSGAQSDYKLDVHSAYVVVSSKAAPDVKALVVNVEKLQFSDASVTVLDGASMDILAGLYQSVLGRQADLSGIEFWADGHQAGAGWGAIALQLVGSAERVAHHDAFNGNATHDLTLLYDALFNRAPDAAGLAFWADAMSHGVSLEHVADVMVQSPEMLGHQLAAPGWNFSV
jgi:hypothetical protein